MIFARFLPAFPQNIGAPRRYSSGRPAIDEAIGYYPSALSLNPPSPKDILIKRIKACVETGSWKQVADDASQVHHFASCRSALLKRHYQVIMLDSFAPWGYEMRHAASLKIGDYDNAVEALEQMHSKLAQSPDPNIQRGLYPLYPDEDGLLTSVDRILRPVCQPIEHTSNDSQNCSMDYPSFPTGPHKHHHWPSPR